MKTQALSKRSASGAWIALGLLDQTPQHGYALYQRICAELRGVWRIEMNRLYALLEEMAEAGLIKGRDEQVGHRPVRRTFRPTAKGQRQFEAWLVAPSANMQQMRIEFPVKLFFALRRGPQATRALIEQQLLTCRQIQSRLSAAQSNLPARSLYHALVYDFRLRQVHAAMTWLEECQIQCETASMELAADVSEKTSRSFPMK